MLDDLLHSYRLDRRSGGSPRQRAFALVLIVAFVLSLIPFFDCPCGGSPRIDVIAAPSDDLAYLAMIHCNACRDTGRRSLADRWFRDPPVPPREVRTFSE